MWSLLAALTDTAPDATAQSASEMPFLHHHSSSTQLNLSFKHTVAIVTDVPPSMCATMHKNGVINLLGWSCRTFKIWDATACLTVAAYWPNALRRLPRNTTNMTVCSAMQHVEGSCTRVPDANSANAIDFSCLGKVFSTSQTQLNTSTPTSRNAVQEPRHNRGAAAACNTAWQASLVKCVQPAPFDKFHSIRFSKLSSLRSLQATSCQSAPGGRWRPGQRTGLHWGPGSHHQQQRPAQGARGSAAAAKSRREDTQTAGYLLRKRPCTLPQAVPATDRRKCLTVKASMPDRHCPQCWQLL